MPLLNWGALSRIERDAAYNNATAVANRAELVRLRDAQSVAYRDAYPAHLGIPYAGGDRTKWDMFPAGNPDAPCLIFIHGGYWQMNSRENFSGLAAGMAEHGWSVAMPGYSLAPEVSLAQIVAELRAGLDWFARHAAGYGIAGKIYISGWSAGGHLAAMLLDHECITAGLAISGVFELGPLRDTYLNEALKLTDDEIEQFSPLRLPPVRKPLAIAYGTAELPALISDGRDFHAHRAGGHAPGPLVPIPHANHFDILEELRQPQGSLARLLVGMARDR